MIKKTILKAFADNLTAQLSHWKNLGTYKEMRAVDGEYSLRVFDELKCIFIHVPKAAGISINKAIFGNLGGGHKTAKAYKSIFGPIVYNRYFVFTIVRNPYSRLVSTYQFLKNGGYNERDRIWAKNNLSRFNSFEDFVAGWLNEQTVWSYIHFVPQYNFISNRYDEIDVDFIGKFETLETDFIKICELADIQGKTLARHNIGQVSGNWRDYYTDEAKKIVYRVYKKDFDLLGYEPDFPVSLY